MSVYLDASVIVALLTDDAHNSRANAFLAMQQPVLAISDFAAAEFAAAIGRHVRTGTTTREEAFAAFASFDAWAARVSQRTTTEAADVTAAAAFLRRLDLNLRTPDALHIAIAQRIGATLATFDEKMAANASILGTPVILA